MTDRYTVESELGRGAFGITYKGIDRQTGKTVAIKIIDVAASEAKGVSQSMILDELRALSALSAEPNCQPNIACYYDAFDTVIDGKRSVIAVTEFVSNGELMNYIESRTNAGTPVDPDTLWKWMKQIISALDYMHAKGYAHRDIKPENIVISETGDLKIIDFGLSCTTACRSGAGTILYMPPEFFADNKPSGLAASKAHDIWSTGVMFYLMANLVYPFRVKTDDGKWLSVQEIAREIYSPLRRSEYKQSSAIISADTYNFLIMSMLNNNWTERPTARVLMQYMGEEEQGCVINGIRKGRNDLIRELHSMSINIDPHDYMSELCRQYHQATGLVNDNFGNYSEIKVVPTYFS